MNHYVLVSEKSWNKEALSFLKQKVKGEWILIDKREDFTQEKLNTINPVKVFIPHWSYIIPEEIYASFECIVFHMTDLPFGRGGSPLQNLIERKIYETKISALRVVKELDAGPLYLKVPLSLWGSAEEIFLRANGLIVDMIATIVGDNCQPQDQVGIPTVFKRRTPDQSNLLPLKTLEEVFDYIRMMDAEGYPLAFIEAGNFRFEFSRASIKADKSIIADVRISEK
jgi:methionyl-tRNA formyltransferase